MFCFYNKTIIIHIIISVNCFIHYFLPLLLHLLLVGFLNLHQLHYYCFLQCYQLIVEFLLLHLDFQSLLFLMKLELAQVQILFTRQQVVQLAELMVVTIASLVVKQLAELVNFTFMELNFEILVIIKQITIAIKIVNLDEVCNH